MSKIKVWLDDERKMPENFTTHVKTADEAIALLAGGNVELISLDHDLGEGAKTGYDVARWIEGAAQSKSLKPVQVLYHTQNPVGKENMRAAIRAAMGWWLLKGDFQHDPKVGDVFRHKTDCKYTMTVKQLDKPTDDIEGWVVWDGIYGGGYPTPYPRFLEIVNNGFWEKISYEAK